MREIKFRAWDVQEKRMSYTPCNPFTPMGASRILETYKKWGTTKFNEHSEHQHPRLEVMQFTGLKDKNGKEIYEGDLFLCHYAKDGCKEQPMQVVYSTEAAAFVFKRRGICQQVQVVQRPYNHSGWGGEIIGNIYENPELLK